MLDEDLCAGRGYLPPPIRLYSQKGWHMAVNLRGLSHERWIPAAAYLIHVCVVVFMESNANKNKIIWLHVSQLLNPESKQSRLTHMSDDPTDVLWRTGCA